MPDIDLTPTTGYWRWHCHDCGYGDMFITKSRTEESVEVHLRTEHREAWPGKFWNTARRDSNGD